MTKVVPIAKATIGKRRDRPIVERLSRIIQGTHKEESVSPALWDWTVMKMGMFLWRQSG
jgi:hypothetical protein